MKLIETDADRPEDESETKPTITPPRPEKRRAYASLILTAVTLIGTVVTIYTVFPARTEESAQAAMRAHHQTNSSWQLSSPGHAELLAWATGVLDGEPPMPADGPDVHVMGARTLDIRHRPAAYVRYAMGDGGVAYQVSFVVQHAEDSPADPSSSVDGDDDVESWRVGAWKCIAIGPAATAPLWKPRIGVP